MLMVLSCSLFAAGTLLAKVLGQDLFGAALHPLQVSAGRFCFAFLAVLPFALWLRPGFRGAAWSVHAGRSLCGWAGVSCLFAAAAVMPLADATALSFLSPLFTMMLAIPLLGERVGPWRWAAVAIGLCGAMILMRPGSGAFQPAALIALSAAVLFGLEAVLIKRLSDREPPIRILAINNAIGATISASAAAFVWTPPSPMQWLILAGIGVSIVSGQALFIQSMRLAEASFVIPFFYATLVFAALYDVAVFGVVPAATSALGAGLIIGAALLQAARERRRKAPGRPAG